MKILIVDDNLKVRELLRTLLANSEDEFEYCEDGDEVIDKCEKFNPDVILMDIKMKRMNGITAVKAVKNKYPKIIVIMITNYPQHELIEESLKAGAQRLIDKEKLFHLPEIMKSIKNII